MNKRIKELAEKASDDIGMVGYHNIPDQYKEKFAELLIRECVEVCNKIYFDRYPEADEWERSEEGDAIKRHFGVAE